METPCPCTLPLPEKIVARTRLGTRTRVRRKDGTICGNAYSVEPATGKFVGWKLREPTPENPRKLVVEDGKVVDEEFTLDHFDLECRVCSRVFFSFRA